MTIPDPTHPEVVKRLPTDTAAGAAAKEVDSTFADLHQLLGDLQADAERLKREINGQEGILRWINIDLADPFGEPTRDQGNPLLLWLVDKCIEGLHYAGQKLAELYANVSPFFTYVGNPELVRRHKDAWIEQIGGPVSERAGWFTPNKMIVDDSWSGPAARAYGNTLSAQNQATASLADLAMKVATSLEGLADGISRFWADLVTAIRKAAENLVIISVGLLSLDAGEVASKIIADLFARTEDILGALQTASETYRHTVTQLSSQLNTNTAFPSAKWPTPGEPISTNINDWTPGKAS